MNTRIWRTGLIALGFVAPLTAAPQARTTDKPATALLKEQFRFGGQPPLAAEVDPVLESAEDVVKMDRIIVRESKLLKQTFQMLDQKGAEEAAKSFTFTGGGRLWEGSFGRYPTELGLWPWEDLLKEDARFQDPPTLAKIDLVHLRW